MDLIPSREAQMPSTLPHATPHATPTTNTDDTPLIPLSKWRRWAVLFTVCWMVVPMNFATSSILAAAPEVASSLSVPATSISAANAGVFLGMAASPLLWGPIGNVLGRRVSYLVAVISLCLCSIGSALAPSMAVFTTIWVIGGTTGVVFLVSGQTILADVFKPTMRGRAAGTFLAFSNASQMIAPLTGGILATYTSWRVIYGVQAGLTLFGGILSFLYIPADIEDAEGELSDKPSPTDPWHYLKLCDPSPVFTVMAHHEILLAGIACGLLSFNHYGLLSAIRFSINQRFHLTTPQTSGLFYLAPGSGYLSGSILGGMLSDRIVKVYIKKRNGVRLPRDRLKSGVFAMLFLLPLGTLLFGWSLDKKIGGMALPAVSAFCAGLALMTSFGGLNTYAVEAVPAKKRQAISCKYIFQYVFAAASVATRIPSMETIGVGWSFTTTSIAAILAGGVVLAITVYKPKSESEQPTPEAPPEAPPSEQGDSQEDGAV